MDMLYLSKNDPLDFSILATMLSDPADLKLVWPEARHPFDETEWLASFPGIDPSASYYVLTGDGPAGHAALFGTTEPDRLHLAWVYLKPELRGNGIGQQLLSLLEAHATDALRAVALTLKTNTFNPRAYHIYSKAGFYETDQQGDTIFMRKDFT